MTTNKPEIFEVYRTRQGALENVVLLADYEALQAELQKLQSELTTVKKVAHGNIELLEENKALQAESALLRAAIRRLCNIYVVDDYYMGQLREERLEAAVNRAIDAATEAAK